MNDLVFGVKLTSEGGQKIATDVGVAAKVFDGLSNSAQRANASQTSLANSQRTLDDVTSKLSQRNQKLASDYSGLDEALKKNSSSVDRDTESYKKLDSELERLMSRINPTYSALKQLDSGRDTLDQGLKSGLISNTQYAESMGFLEKNFKSVTSSGNDTISMTHRAQGEFVILGREVMNGNMSRVPSALSIIAQGMSPMLLGITAVTAAVVAGGYAWYQWANQAKEATREAEASLAEAEKLAKSTKHMTSEEEIQDINKQIAALKDKNYWLKQNTPTMQQVAKIENGKLFAGDSEERKQRDLSLKTVKANEEAIANLERNAKDIQDRGNKKVDSALSKQQKEEERKQQKAIDELNKSGAHEVSAAQSALDKQIEHNAQIGLTRQQVDLLTASKLESAAASDSETASNYRAAAPLVGALHDAYLQHAADLDMVAKAKREQAAVVRDGADKQVAADAQKKAEADSKKAADASAKEWAKTTTDISNGLSDALMKGFDSGAFAQKLADTVKNTFKNLVLEPTVKAIVQSGMSAVGIGAATDAAAGTASAGGIGASVGAFMATPVGIGAAVVVGGALLAKAGFGWGNDRYNVGDARLVGQFSRAGFKGQMAQDWRVDGGWFGGGDSGTTYTAINAYQSRSYKAMVDGLQLQFNQLGSAIGDLSVQTRNWTFNANHSGDVTAALADSMGSQLIPQIDKFRLSGEDLAKTAQRLNGVFTSTNSFIVALGVSSQAAFGSMGIDSAAARMALTDAAGGSAAFNQKAGSFVQNFLTGMQQLQPALDAVGRTFNELKITGIETNKQFADRVALELKNKNYNAVDKLLSVADAFNAVTTAAANTSQQLVDMLKTNAFASLQDYTRAVAQARAASTNPLANAGSMIKDATATTSVVMGQEASVAASAKRKADKAAALAVLNDAINQKNLWVASRAASASGRSYTTLINQLLQKVAAAQANYDALPAFANGGDHTGGFRIVGERGPELEYTGPSRIFSNGQSQSLLDTSGLLAEMKKMYAEIKVLRENQQRDNSILKTYSKLAAETLDNVSGGGGPLLVKLS